MSNKDIVDERYKRYILSKYDNVRKYRIVRPEVNHYAFNKQQKERFSQTPSYVHPGQCVSSAPRDFVSGYCILSAHL